MALTCDVLGRVKQLRILSRNVKISTEALHITAVMDRCSVSRPTATAWLGALANAGMLQDVKIGRDRLFINREFLRLLVRPELTRQPDGEVKGPGENQAVLAFQDRASP
ncbi:hypothetical protein [Mycolicibacter senuensis]